jgi:Chromo shadow domain
MSKQLIADQRPNPLYARRPKATSPPTCNMITDQLCDLVARRQTKFSANTTGLSAVAKQPLPRVRRRREERSEVASPQELQATSPPATKKWTPPSGSWENLIDQIDACEEEGSGKLVVYLGWKNGQKTKHDTSVIYKKCPQKVSTLTICIR